MKARFSVLAGAGVVLLAAQESGVLAQTFQRLGACPTLGKHKTARRKECTDSFSQVVCFLQISKFYNFEHDRFNISI